MRWRETWTDQGGHEMERHEQIREDMRWRETWTDQGGHEMERDMNRSGRI